MLKILPSENILYKTQLSCQDVFDRLAKTESYKRCGKGFVNNTFSIQRIISYNNSFLPIIQGTVLEYPQETIIEVRMKTHIFVTVFTIIWLSIVLALCLFFGKEVMTSDFSIFSLIPFVAFIFGILLFYGAFKFESRKSIKELREIFQAEIISA